MTVMLAVDAMSGDKGVAATVPAAIRFLKDYPDAKLILVGDKKLLHQVLASQMPFLEGRLTIQHASTIVKMDESPQVALRSKKDSSMRITIEQVKENRAQAAISAGNTGALMAMAYFVLKMLPNIHRPAIAKFIPRLDGVTCVLDLGANLDATPDQLLQFGLMGAELMRATEKIASPKIGLLNIGTEETKGSDTLRRARELMLNSDLNYQGYVEGNDLFSGVVHVVVTDGFTGNIALKTSEGLAHLISGILHEEFNKTWWRRCCALAALPTLKHVRARLDPRRYNGASLLGLRGLVVKSHGSADEQGFYYALVHAYLAVHQHIVKHIAQHAESMAGT
ncbi:MAG: phosphate acyltransferase PlsX [Neisseriales bacterium]|nr:MAG: phosphate acyltransferase PlsX [Neisseriales bacterium]